VQDPARVAALLGDRERALEHRDRLGAVPQPPARDRHVAVVRGQVTARLLGPHFGRPLEVVERLPVAAALEVDGADVREGHGDAVAVAELAVEGECPRAGRRPGARR